jgi:hypothetical protein
MKQFNIENKVAFLNLNGPQKQIIKHWRKKKGSLLVDRNEKSLSVLKKTTYKPKSKKAQNAIGFYSYHRLKKQHHKLFKQLTIKTFFYNSINPNHPSLNKLTLLLKVINHSKNSKHGIRARVIKSFRKGFTVLTSYGLISFIKKRHYKKVLKYYKYCTKKVCKFKYNNLSFKRYKFLFLLKKPILAEFNTIELHLSKIKVSRKYKIIQRSKIFRTTLKPLIQYENPLIEYKKFLAKKKKKRDFKLTYDLINHKANRLWKD